MHRFLPLLLLLFVGSGCAALIYEVVWFQLLQLVIGSSAVSLGVLLGVYMGGMCLGSLLLPRLVPSAVHPLRLYALIEAGIGLCGVLVLYGVPHLDGVYAAMYPVIAVNGFAAILLRGAICALCLLLPTLLMGASLPAMARWVESSREGVAWLGFFYGGNIVGAVFGSVLAGFYLLRLYDMPFATWVAVAINACVAIVGLALASVAAYAPLQQQGSLDEAMLEESSAAAAPEPAVAGDLRPQPLASRPVYLAIALSGLCALGAEVVWTRLLSLMLGATVYTFSLILAVFLVGLGLGSSVGAVLAKRWKHPSAALGVCQFLLAGTAAWAAFAIAKLVPSADFDPTIPVNPMDVFQMDLFRCAWAILPSACLWGASFPLALSALAQGRREQDAGALVGKTYAANTAGAITGALLFSMILIPATGTQQAERWLVILSAVAAILALWRKVDAATITKAAAIALVAAGLAWTVQPVPWLALGYGRRMNQYVSYNSQPLYIGEGMNSSIVVSQYPNGTRYFHVSGKVEATTETFDMRLQRMLGHLSALFTKQPESVLIVGFGAGVTAGTFVQHPTVKKITISEIEPLIPPASTKYFREQNYDVLHDPRTEIHYDDARHFILTTNEKFDVITSDPIHPWVKGTSTLYSKEYFELCKQHLKPGGVVTQWVPLYESDFATIQSELATFFSVFPHGTVWNSDVRNQGYDVVLIGQADPAPIDVDEWKDRLNRPDHQRVLASLAEVGLGSAYELISTYAGRDDDLRPWLKDAQINQDRNMRLQYLAGWGLNFNHPDWIYQNILEYRKFPNGMFTGSERAVEPVRRMFGIQLPATK
ncbi:MAG: fused MFS/spermidine synthase [Bryobacteraceae bacterium]